jgi:hypothetical protein
LSHPIASLFSGKSENQTSSLAFANLLPILVFAPSAVALIWVQISQLLQVSFTFAAYVTVILFLASFCFLLVGIARSTLIDLMTKDRSWILLVGICLVFSVLAFVLVRWDSDDNDYLSNAVYFLAHPDKKMGFEIYYLHDDDGPLTAIAWLNSYAGEYFLASFSHVLGLDFLSLYWSGKSIIAAFLIPCAWYSLFLRFGIKHNASLVAIVVSLLVIFIMGDTFNSYGNWFLTHLTRGKVIFMALGLPLIWNYTLAYLEKPNLTSWIGLFSIASASIALTTMAGFIVPFTMVALVLAYCIAYRVKFWLDLKRFFGLASAFTYLLAVTLYIRLNMNPAILDDNAGMIQHYSKNYLGQLSFITDLSFPLSAAIIILATILAILFLAGKKRHLLAWWCGIYGILFISPVTINFLMENVTSSNIYWRMFHAYPIPLVVGISAALFYNYVISLRRVGQVIAISLAGLFLAWPHMSLVAQIAFGWERTAPTIIRAIHRVSFGGHRISYKRQRSIKEILQQLPDGPVLAAHPANVNIPIFSGKHPQIFSRQHQTDYLFFVRGDPQRGQRREMAARFANGNSASNVKIFFKVLEEEPNLISLVLHPRAVEKDDVLAKIVKMGFRDVGEAGGFRLFTRR